MPKSQLSKEPLVSICVPTKERVGLLGESIATLQKQIYSRIEIIIFDNASSDGTQAWAERMAKKDPRIRYFRQPKAVPAIRNFNDAIAKATGEFIMLGADDDLWKPSYISTIMHEFARDTQNEVALINTRFGVIDQKGTWQRKHKCSFSNLPGRELSLGTFLREDFHGYKANVFFGIHRAECLRAVGGYKRISSLAASDILTIADILSRWKIWIVPKRLFFKREFFLSGRPGVWTDHLAFLFQLKESLWNMVIPASFSYLLSQSQTHFWFLRTLKVPWLLAFLSASRVFFHLVPNTISHLKARNISFYGKV